MDGTGRCKRNDVLRRFKASNATVLLAGKRTLKRSVTVNGTNQILIMRPDPEPGVEPGDDAAGRGPLPLAGFRCR
jgi:hypothetical protein